jgi:hypothetical protein
METGSQHRGRGRAASSNDLDMPGPVREQRLITDSVFPLEVTVSNIGSSNWHFFTADDALLRHDVAIHGAHQRADYIHVRIAVTIASVSARPVLTALIIHDS